MPLTYESIAAFLSDRLALAGNELVAETPLFSDGLLDSFSLIELVEFVETGLGRKVPPREISLANFDSISRILAYVQRTAKSDGARSAP